MDAKEILTVIALIVPMAKILYDAGYQGRTMKQHDKDIEKIYAKVERNNAIIDECSDRIKKDFSDYQERQRLATARVHGKIEKIQAETVSSNECIAKYTAFDNRIEGSYTTLCNLLNEVKKNQADADKKLGVVNEQIIHLSKEIADLKGRP